MALFSCRLRSKPESLPLSLSSTHLYLHDRSSLNFFLGLYLHLDLAQPHASEEAPCSSLGMEKGEPGRVGAGRWWCIVVVAVADAVVATAASVVVASAKHSCSCFRESTTADTTTITTTISLTKQPTMAVSGNVRTVWVLIGTQKAFNNDGQSYM